MGVNSKPDFGGYATKNNILCEDGRVIRHNAFAACDGKTANERKCELWQVSSISA